MLKGAGKTPDCNAPQIDVPLQAFHCADKSKIYEAARAASTTLGVRSPIVSSGNPAECYTLAALLEAYVCDQQARDEMHAVIAAYHERAFLAQSAR